MEHRHPPENSIDLAVAIGEEDAAVEYRHDEVGGKPRQHKTPDVVVGASKDHVNVGDLPRDCLNRDRRGHRGDISVRGNRPDVVGKNVHLPAPYVARSRSVHARHIALRQMVRIDESEAADPESRELLRNRRARPAAADDGHTEGGQYALDVSAEGPDVSIKRWVEAFFNGVSLAATWIRDPTTTRW